VLTIGGTKRETQKGDNMNYGQVVVGVVGIAAVVAICGCVHKAVETGDSAGGDMHSSYQSCKCEHVHMRSVLGLTDEVLADTNRFPLGTMRHSHYAKLDRPILGCTDANFYLDELVRPRRYDTRKTPHRLRSVELKRVLPDDATADTLRREGKNVIGEIARWLDVEPPDIELVDVNKWRKEFERIQLTHVHTMVCFDLAKEQKITVRLVEGGYVVRDGIAMLASPSRIEVAFTYSHKLFNAGFAWLKQESTNDTIKVEKELDIGDDCADKLAKAIRRDIAEQAARRKKQSKPQP
jgi:hypothetical protein